jgi:TonB family protein
MSLRKLISWTALFGASLGLHAAGFAKLDRMGGTAPAKVASKPTFMEMTPSPKPSTPPPPIPEEKPAPKVVRRLASVTAPRAPATAQAQAKASAEARPPVAETVADFSGTTLTNEGAGWASATGNGAPMGGPIGRPGARVTGRRVEGVSQPARPAEPALVAVADLSRKPEAPALQDILERNYPTEARQSGQSGKAVVRARITADGSVRDLMVLSETGQGFGRACRDTLAGSRWTPPLDQGGKAVATIINYTCRFEVR